MKGRFTRHGLEGHSPCENSCMMSFVAREGHLSSLSLGLPQLELEDDTESLCYKLWVWSFKDVQIYQAGSV